MFQPTRVRYLSADATAGAGRMAPPTSTKISARLKRAQGHVSAVNVVRAKNFDLDYLARYRCVEFVNHDVI